MTLLEFLRQWQPSRLTAGVLASVLLHVALIAGALWTRPFEQKSLQKRGDALYVEMPKPAESPPPGPPAQAAAPSPAPSPAAPRPAPPVTARPEPPKPAVAKSTPPAPRRDAERQVASAQPPAPEASEPAPAPRVAETPPAPRAAESPAPEPRSQAGPQVAAVTPGRSTGPPVPDIRSLGRGGGAGGSGLDRGGIEGEPIPLESKDPRYGDYFEKIRQAIKSKWGYPCVKQGVECDYKTTELLVEFGIGKDGRLVFVNLMHGSRWQVYDDYALNAIRLAAPFPPVPPPLLQGNGLPIAARFSYVVERGFTNILR